MAAPTAELPPRARRIPSPAFTLHPHSGTTSACAENTRRRRARRCPPRNYLRVRGEYPVLATLPSAAAELPPRARRIPGLAPRCLPRLGTTSACAENTRKKLRIVHETRNYLRVRGEYQSGWSGAKPPTELPPRARRILLRSGNPHHQQGTTSACAENTMKTKPRKGKKRNYLRVRGEYSLGSMSPAATAELPPRARRILMSSRVAGIVTGTTSACAENTAPHRTDPMDRRNYLRVRGEYRGRSPDRGASPELPPRARRILFAVIVKLVIVGTTSACAENTQSVPHPHP